jgi:protein-S-isoprenylcysteine O-methyltransferase Ste14
MLRFLPPPVLFMVCFAAASLAERLWPWSIPGLDHRAGLGTGVAILVAAGSFGSWAAYEMWRHRTPIEPGHVPKKLVTTGPFRFTRNPLYVTLVLILTASALMIQSVWLIVGAAVLVALLDRLVIVREERVIREHFGEEYAAYVARVRRWV